MLQDVSYLTRLTEDTIYESYREAIACDHTRPFIDFTQEQRDAYLRLKMRGVRPANLVAPISNSQQFVARVEEEKMPNAADAMSLNSLQ